MKINIVNMLNKKRHNNAYLKYNTGIFKGVRGDGSWWFQIKYQAIH